MSAAAPLEVATGAADPEVDEAVGEALAEDAVVDAEPMLMLEDGVGGAVAMVYPSLPDGKSCIVEVMTGGSDEADGMPNVEKISSDDVGAVASGP